ncbi:MAG: hypothetical protein NZ898_00370 [Myxococcota bacterium]|nr:hypothetical protein [Myxococcota bacterium]MDW8361997.1 hypothetical protein [Myxococcales bacterium]
MPIHLARPAISLVTLLLVPWVPACGGGDDESPADRVGIGAQCMRDDDCMQSDQRCLTNFRGGYCGKRDCTADADCPSGSACVRHDDGVQYCFRLCTDKPECNRHRDPENEANCVSSITFVDPAREAGSTKACVPPSSG